VIRRKESPLVIGRERIVRLSLPPGSKIGSRYDRVESVSVQVDQIDMVATRNQASFDSG
jgi:hypothetical protein